MTAVDWNDVLGDQLAWHWHHQLRPRLAGLTDDEYLWEPAPGVTTIAWRLAHITDDCLAARTASHFGGAPPGGGGAAPGPLCRRTLCAGSTRMVRSMHARGE